MKKFKKVFAFVMVLTMMMAIMIPMTASAKTVDPYQSAGVYSVSTATVHSSANSVDYTVYYPTAIKTTEESFPVIAWANGTGCVTSLYTNFLKFVAAHGYIVIADPNVMTGDGTSQAASVDFAISLNADSSMPFYNHIDTDRIGAMGHSQGGKSTVNAALLNDKIDCIVSIAGSSDATDSTGLKVPSFFMGGTLDGMVMPDMWVKPAYNNCPAPAVYALLNGAEHCACMFYPDRLQGYTVAWFDAYLKDDTNALALFTTPGAGLQADKDWRSVAVKNF